MGLIKQSTNQLAIGIKNTLRPILYKITNSQKFLLTFYLQEVYLMEFSISFCFWFIKRDSNSGYLQLLFHFSQLEFTSEKIVIDGEIVNVITDGDI